MAYSRRLCSERERLRQPNRPLLPTWARGEGVHSLSTTASEVIANQCSADFTGMPADPHAGFL
eukprot:1159805-Pelagomonas_calceolata.AAC.13